MLREIRSIFNLVHGRNLALIALVLGGLFLGACADVIVQDPPVKGPLSDVYNDSYEHVWRAVQLAMRKYPVKTNIFDSGLLETDYVKADKIFSDPNDTKSPLGLRYRLVIHAVKGKIEGQSVIKVTVNKVSEIQSDFFSGYHPIDSDGLEEEVVLYRIGRFLEIK